MTGVSRRTTSIAIAGCIRRRRDAAAGWNTKAATAQPGQTWTVRYSTPRAVDGGAFQSYTSGPVRIIGDDCPVPQYRGHKNLGEMNLDTPMKPGWFGPHPATRYLLTPGDDAPSVHAGSGDDLLAVPAGRTAMVEHVDASLNLRNVEIGQVGDVADFNDGADLGRYVGDSWVRLSEVTGVEW